MAGADDLITLTEAARLIPGATKDTLLRLARAGNLVVYRVGKHHTTTRADLDKAIKASRVKPKIKTCTSQSAPKFDAPSAALDVALARLNKPKTK